MKNFMVGNKVVILGSGDIGLIMARRMMLEGAEVLMVLEKLPYPSGLPRNINQCLRDFDIPLYLNQTVINIHGSRRLTGVTVAELDSRGEAGQDAARFVECDTLMLSVGLIPENELSRQAGVKLDSVTGGAVVDDYGQTSVPGIFSCGNVLQIHDLVDNVSIEGEQLAPGVYDYVSSGSLPPAGIPVSPGDGIRYCVPQYLSGKGPAVISFRPSSPGTGKTVIFSQNGKVVKRKLLVKANPAEMERIEIDPELSNRLLQENGELKVDLISDEIRS